MVPQGVPHLENSVMEHLFRHAGNATLVAPQIHEPWLQDMIADLTVRLIRFSCRSGLYS